MTTLIDTSRRVVGRDLDPTTEILSQLHDPAVADNTVIQNRYYATCGRLDNDDLIEMWVVEQRMIGSLSTAQHVVLALNGKSNRRHYALDGRTSCLADWLRGYHFAAPSCRRDDPCFGGTKILHGLYSDLD